MFGLVGREQYLSRLVGQDLYEGSGLVGRGKGCVRPRRSGYTCRLCVDSGLIGRGRRVDCTESQAWGESSLYNFLIMGLCLFQCRWPRFLFRRHMYMPFPENLKTSQCVYMGASQIDRCTCIFCEDFRRSWDTTKCHKALIYTTMHRQRYESRRACHTTIL
jgi:hypothetical protein